MKVTIRRVHLDRMGYESQGFHYCRPGRIVSCDGESFFSWSCDLPGFKLGADMLEYTVLYDD